MAAFCLRSAGVRISLLETRIGIVTQLIISYPRLSPLCAKADIDGLGSAPAANDPKAKFEISDQNDKVTAVLWRDS